MKILVVLEVQNGKVKKGSLELLSQAIHWPKAEVHALAMGASGSLGAVAGDLRRFAPAKLHLAQHDHLNSYSPDAFAFTVAEAAKALGAAAILSSTSAQTKDYFPRLAVKLDTGMASDCTSLKCEGDQLVAKRPLYAGKLTATVEFKGTKPQVATVRPNALGFGPEKAGDVAIENSSIAPPTPMAKVNEVIAKAGAANKVDLTEAERIVSGGRSLKSAENFKVLEELAAVMGATVGASRAAVDAGFRPHSDQVGQTGKTVSPTLYMAFGISGAIQHLAGMRSSKVIVAINTDPQAPIFQKADYGVQADLFAFAPALTEAMKKALH
jgi:electron transfer flavoprotein alpha subunit